MISHLRGHIQYKGDRYLVVDVAGVGYRLQVSADTLKNTHVGTEPVGFWTHLAVKEDALDLYGFVDRRELEFFELLIGVSGIGPKSALAILSLAPPETLERAIVSGDANYLTKVSGVGRKSAEKIVLELKDKLGAIESVGLREDLELEADSLEALKALGYNQREAREALRRVPDTVRDPSERVREALKLLGR